MAKESCKNGYNKRHVLWEEEREIGIAFAHSIRKKLVVNLFPQPINTCLDIGCGTGEYTLELLRREANVHAVDISEFAIKKLKSKIKSESLAEIFFGFVSDINNFELKDQYDLILLIEVLEHMKDEFSLLKKTANLLKKGGTLILSVPNDPKLWSVYDEFSGHVRRYKLQGLTELIEKAGLRVEKSYCYGFPMLRLVSLLKKKFGTKNLVEKTTTIKARKGLYLLINMAKHLFNVLLFCDRRFLSTSKGIGLIVVAKKKEA